MKSLTKLRWILLGFVGVLSLYLVLIFGFSILYKDKIYPGVTVAGVSVGSKTRAEATEILNRKIQEYEKEDIIIGSQKTTTKKLGVDYKVVEAAENAYRVGSKNPFFLGRAKDLPVEFKYSPKEYLTVLKDEEKTIGSSIRNSEIRKEGERITVKDGSAGKRIDYAKTTANFISELRILGNDVRVETFDVPPTFTAAEFDVSKADVLSRVAGAIVLTSGEKEYEVPAETVYSWIQLESKNRVKAYLFEKDSLFSPLLTTEEPGLYSRSKIRDYLADLSKEVDREPVNAALTVSDGRAIVFVPSRKGAKLNIEESTEGVAEALDKGLAKTELVVSETEPEIREDSLNNLGIKELVATGYSNFAGSPQNRKHNIKTGASKFNGVLIKPGETFSFNKILGPVEASTGYLPELVILENKTQPQYGGGLCQVSSTAFRAALNAGLPILERKAHAYPVTYYKPFGVDATIYLPKPDLVFTNDTESHILIQTKIEGTKLTFEFYGTKPNRKISFAGNKEGSGSVPIVEKVSPYIYDQGVRGKGSFTAVFYRFIYDAKGKLVNTKHFLSKYDSPDKYPH